MASVAPGFGAKAAACRGRTSCVVPALSSSPSLLIGLSRTDHILLAATRQNGRFVDPFVAQLARLCTTHRTRAKWVFVPTHAIGRMLGDRLVLEGTDWANLRFVTPLDIALRMGAPFLVERGIDPSEEGLGPALIMRLLLGLPAEPSYFRPLANHPAMAQALWTTIRELRMSGVRPDDLVADAFASKAKHAEMCALYRAYETFLSSSARGDMATVYEEALRHADWCPIQAQDC